ncbi:hypothetical protein ACQKTA_07255 [Enterococcus sp. 22-H-5-01]|uniref:hypothetical protein n=1 Tax=Enterococcus sp. 22-H-5-01 TaxID=3418555 RepID=UPI003CFE427A
MIIKKLGFNAIDNNEMSLQSTNEQTQSFDDSMLEKASTVPNTSVTEETTDQLEEANDDNNSEDNEGSVEERQTTMTGGFNESTSEESASAKKIPGYISKSKGSNGIRSRGRRGLRKGSVTKEIYLFVREHYGMDTPFVTEGVYEEFIQRGYCSSDVSGHLYSLKQQGYLESDDWSDAELASYGFDGEENRLRKNLKKWVLIKENQLNKCNDEKTRDGGVSNDEH